MGISLNSIHIYCDNSAGLPGDFSYLQLSEHWQTVTSAIPHGQSEAVARKLSKAVDAPVLWFDYFDDDELQLRLLVNGASVAYHVHSHLSGNLGTKITNFALTLGRDKAEKTAISNILKCDDLQTKVDLLEEFFDVNLMVDDAFFAEAEFSRYRRKRGNENYLQYLAEIKKVRNIQNHTRLTMVFEEELQLLDCLHGQYRLKKHYYYAYRPNGEHIYTRMDPQDVYFLNGELAVVPQGTGLSGEGPRQMHHHQNSFVHKNENGEAAWEFVVPQGQGFSAKPCSGGGFVWISLHENSETGGGYLLKLDQSTGDIVLQMPHMYSGRAHSLLLQYHNGHLFSERRQSPQWGTPRFFAEMDEDFNVLRTCPIDKRILGTDDPFVSSEGILYFNCFNDLEMAYLNLETMESKVVRLPKQLFIERENPDKTLWAFGSRSVCLLDKELNVLSLHPLKGGPIDLRDGYLLTQQWDERCRGEPQKTYARIYRIEDVK